MATKRVSKVKPVVTAEEYQEALAAYALADAQRDKTMARMNMEITRAREKYDAELASLKAEMDERYEVVELYCRDNKGVLFSHARSMDTAHGKVGFRLGMPKLKTLPRFTWEKVLDKLKAIMPEAVRRKEEVDKDFLIANRSEAGVAEHLNEVGVYVDQDEAFFIELKKEEAEV